MYIWRGKTRRDRRQHLLSGPFDWGPTKEARSCEKDDDKLQYNGERAHVEFFQNKMRSTINAFLDTPAGKAEIELVIEQLENGNRLRHEEGSHDPDAPIVPVEMTKKNNIYEVFRKYDTDGSGAISPIELRTLLTDLNVKMKSKDYIELVLTLDPERVGEIEFEEFYKCQSE